MIREYRRKLLEEAEAAAVSGALDAVLRKLRVLSPDEFALLLANVPGRYPGLRSILPSFPDAETQKGWTGDHGLNLLQKTALFWRVVDHHVGAGGKSILDYGCGWGRLTRQAYYYSDPENVYGVDPWDRSIEVCRSHRLTNIHHIDYEPTSLPGPDGGFDLATAFSVFTHIGEATARTILTTVARATKAGGTFVITIRPVEYWANRSAALGEDLAARYAAEHRAGGYVFHPAQKLSAQEVLYGETSADPSVYERIAVEHGWALTCIEQLLIDPQQIILFLTRVDAG